MTVIAWDGETLAADRSSTFDGGYSVSTTKIFRISGGWLVGAAGKGDVCRALIQWAMDGFKPEDFPQSAKDGEADMLAVSRHGALRYNSGPYPLPIEDRYIAIGCGRDFALAAMYLGKGAKEAVQVACDLDIYCGNGIDTLTLEPLQ